MLNNRTECFEFADGAIGVSSAGWVEVLTQAASRDGTEIGYWTSGEGPPLVLVHGGPADHTRWSPLLPYLQPHATVHAMDRRGRGASGDGPEYDMAREFEDVAAVVDAVAAASGSAVDVYGHSFGASCALGGATLTSSIRKLAVYEPPVHPTLDAYPPGMLERLDAMLAEGKQEEVAEAVFREALSMPDEEFTAFKAQPSWPARVGAAHTIPRESRVELGGAFDPSLAANITVPTLLLTGEESPDFLKADIATLAKLLPNARVIVLEGQQHVADVLAPDLFANHLLAFLGE
jgi:pimeloyl-ACP methyl ester carboxylesterase